MLSEVLPATAFGFLLITVRIAAIFMVIPIFSDTSIPQRIRVALALAISLIIYPSVAPSIPPMSDMPLELLMFFLKEVTIGLMLGLSVRLLLSSVHTAGTIIAFQTGLSAAQSFDPSQGSQSVIIAAFMNLLAMTLILVTNLHHLMIMGMVYSFDKFPIGESLPIADFATVAVQFVSGSFALGFQMSAPFIVYGIVYNLGLGLIARMIPGFQVFFVGMPINIFLGFALFMVLIGSIMRLFLDKYAMLLASIIG